MALSQRQVVPTDQENELLYLKGTTGAAGKAFAVVRVGRVEDEWMNRRGVFRRSCGVPIWPLVEANHRPITPSVNPSIRKARLGTLPSTGSGGEL